MSHDHDDEGENKLYTRFYNSIQIGRKYMLGGRIVKECEVDGKSVSVLCVFEADKQRYCQRNTSPSPLLHHI